MTSACDIGSCPAASRGDGYCDAACNVAACGLDCGGANGTTCDCECSPGCSAWHLGGGEDGYACYPACYSFACNYAKPSATAPSLCEGPHVTMADPEQQQPTPVTHRTERPASAQAELLPDGSLYVSITSGGSGYASDAPPAAHLSGSWAARAGTAAPALSVRVGSGGLVEAIELGCELSGARPDNGGTGCLRTAGFG